jgi:hypothetical protein
MMSRTDSQKNIVAAALVKIASVTIEPCQYELALLEHYEQGQLSLTELQELLAKHQRFMAGSSLADESLLFLSRERAPDQPYQRFNIA